MTGREQDALDRTQLNSLVPLVQVESVPRSMGFYRKLGFAVRNTHTPEGGTEPVWAWLESDGAHLMISRAGEAIDPRAQAVLYYLYCPDALALRGQLVEAGVDVGPMQYPFWAPNGEFRVEDPDGYVLMVTHT